MDKREDEGSLIKSEAEERGYARLAPRDNPLSVGSIDLLKWEQNYLGILVRGPENAGALAPMSDIPAKSPLPCISP
jgi:hypothetical protein